jgi:hypothetical protein
MKIRYCAGLICSIVFCGQLSASLLTVNVQSFSSQFTSGSDRRAIHAVDGSGLDASNPPNHGTDPQTMWLTNGDGSFSSGATDPDLPVELGHIVFDLSGTFLVTDFRVWNYNEFGSGTAWNNRSVRNLNISTAQIASGPFTPLINPGTGTTTFTFAQAPSSPSYTGQLFTFTTPFQAAFVRFDLLSNYGPDAGGIDHKFVGLSEIQFSGALPTPEPGSFSFVAAVFLMAGALRGVKLRRTRVIDGCETGKQP